MSQAGVKEAQMQDGMAMPRFHIKKVLMISVAHMVHDIYSSFLAPILPLLIEKLGLSYGLAGSLSMFQRLPSLFNPVIGMIAERVSARYFVIVSPGLTAVVMSLLGVAPHYIVLVLLLLVMGFSATLFHVPSPVMIKRVAGDRTGGGMSFYMLGGKLARTIGPLVILGAVSVWGLEGTWWLMPFGIAASVVLYFQFHRIRISDQFSGGKEKLRIGAYLSILQLSGAAGTFLAGGISDRIGRKPTLLASAVISPAMLWLFLSLDGIPAVIALIVLGLTLFAPGPVMLALVQDQEAERPVFLNGVYMGISFLLAALGVQLVGAAGDMFGLRETFYMSAELSLGAIPRMLLLRYPEHEAQR